MTLKELDRWLEKHGLVIASGVVRPQGGCPAGASVVSFTERGEGQTLCQATAETFSEAVRLAIELWESEVGSVLGAAHEPR